MANGRVEKLAQKVSKFPQQPPPQSSARVGYGTLECWRRLGVWSGPTGTMSTMSTFPPSARYPISRSQVRVGGPARSGSVSVPRLITTILYDSLLRFRLLIAIIEGRASHPGFLNSDRWGGNTSLSTHLRSILRGALLLCDRPWITFRIPAQLVIHLTPRILLSSFDSTVSQRSS